MTLSKREAKLRAEAVIGIAAAMCRLDGRERTAFRSAIHNRPRAALQAIGRAEDELRKAKRALRAWARRAE